VSAVANPDYVELKELLADARNYQGLNADLLAVRARLMGNGGAWTGPGVATAFTEDVNLRNTDLGRYFDSLTDSIQQEVASAARTVGRVG
jgi:hypothetical protein